MDPREYSQDELDNHANQMNSNNDAYWSSRGVSDWDDDDDNTDDDDERYEDYSSDALTSDNI